MNALVLDMNLLHLWLQCVNKLRAYFDAVFSLWKHACIALGIINIIIKLKNVEAVAILNKNITFQCD